MATAGSSTCTDCITCDYDNAITSFPLRLGVTPSDILYDSVDEPISMDFQWSTRTTSPQFLPPSIQWGSGQIDEVSTMSGGSGNSNTSTLRYNGTTYQLYSVQIAGASHTSWLNPPTLIPKNTEDIIITFYNGGTSIPINYITVVIPILRTGAASSDPPYLTALSSTSGVPGSYIISSCLPKASDGTVNKKTLFAYYVTCLDGYTQHKTPENMFVFVAVGGLPVSNNLMSTLGTKVSASGAFPPVTLPFITHFANYNTVIRNAEFTQYIMSTRHLMDFAGMVNIYKDLTLNERTDPTSAYKCVPLDPDNDIVDGNLKIDLDNGQILTDVLAERDAARSANLTPQINSAAASKVQKNLGIALGSILVVLIALVLIYFIFSLASVSVPTTLYGMIGYSRLNDGPDDVATTTTATSSPFMQNLPTYGIIAIITGLIGFTVGMLIP